MNRHRNSPVCVILLLAARVAAAETTERVSVDSAGVQGNDDCKWSAISADARYVVFDSFASNLVPNDTNNTVDVFLFDRETGATTRVSVDAAGAEGDSGSDYPTISADGRYVAFSSEATNLVPGDTNGRADIFVRDLQTGSVERVSVNSAGGEGDKLSSRPSLSSDGRHVAFYSSATNLVPGDTNGTSDSFVFDRQTRTIERVSVDSAGGQSNGGSYTTTISGDGNRVAFVSDATNLVPGDSNGKQDVFVHDRLLHTTIRVSVDSAGTEGMHGHSDSARISEDGHVVAFYSAADNLVPGDTNKTGDIFVHDLPTGTTELVSSGLAGAVGNKASLHPRISMDGRYIEFQSFATDLVSNDTNGAYDVFLRDRQRGTTRRISVDSNGAQGDGDSHSGSLAPDGSYATFFSHATNLVAGDSNGVADIFVHHLCLPASWSNYGTGFPGALGVPGLTARSNPVLGTTVTVDLGDSTSLGTIAAVLIGDQPVANPTRKGGDLLVLPFTSLLLTVPAGGTTLVGDVPDDEALCNYHLFVQALELDLAAAEGLSFTAGLELVFGS